MMKDFSDIVGNGEKNKETNLVSTRGSIDIKSAIKGSDILQKVALKWMPIAVLAAVVIILIWA